MFSRPCLLCGLLASSVIPGAALEWQTRSLTLTTAPFQTTQDVIFHFTNTGRRAVRILGVESNCDCLVGTASAQIYAPGASGLITASFTIGDRLGLYERRIKVLTDESNEPVQLQVNIEVPEVVALTPRSLAWHLNETGTEKSLAVQVIAGLKINLTRVQVTNDGFAARLVAIEPGRSYRLYLKPHDTARPANAAIRIFGQAGSGQDVIVSAYGNVR